MNFARQQSRRLDPASMRLPLIALIDVVLFLLFYFIVAGNLAAEEGELASTLKTSSGGNTGGNALLQAPLIEVKSQNGRPRFLLGARALETQEALGSVLVQLPKDPGVLIKADPDAPVEFTAAAMQAASDAGFTKVTFVTRTR